MNYVFIAEDKFGKDTVLVKKLSDECYLKVSQLTRMHLSTPSFEFMYVDSIDKMGLWADTMIDDPNEVERIEEQILSDFNALFGKVYK